jgi:hypothetical protein
LRSSAVCAANADRAAPAGRRPPGGSLGHRRQHALQLFNLIQLPSLGGHGQADDTPVVSRQSYSPLTTVFTVKNAAGERRHFMIVGASPVECESMEAGFGPMLLEPHPTRTITVRDQHVHPYRYSLCWSAFERYEPRTAEQLAQLRANRERRRQERQQLRWVEENPLLAWAERGRQDDLPAEEEGGGR